MTIAVLGAGMVGRAIAMDLATQYEVTSVDYDNANLQLLQNQNASIQTIQTDLSHFEAYPRFLSPYDLVVTAVPGHLGYRVLEAVINNRKNVVDISFFPEDALQLDDLARQNSVTAITDCGVAPGASNLILGRFNQEMKLDSFTCYVGGLPANKKQPWQYKAPFSPVDVIQEYIRPARLMENGSIVTKPALSDRERLHFEEIGELEAFNTDGLRSLIYTMAHIPDMKEKTLRYPGHIDLIIALQESGFFEEDPIILTNGKSISPLELTSRLLINEWKLDPGEDEFTIMQVIVKGTRDGKPKTIQFDLLDHRDAITGISSMARTTGYTCTAAVNLLVKQLFTEKGLFPPEKIGAHKLCFEYMMNYLAERNVNWRMKEN